MTSNDQFVMVPPLKGEVSQHGGGAGRGETLTKMHCHSSVMYF